MAALLVLHTGRGAKVQVDQSRETRYSRQYDGNKKKQFAVQWRKWFSTCFTRKAAAPH